jgi:hypothetical protein
MALKGSKQANNLMSQVTGIVGDCIADGQSGLLAELDGGSHNSEAWGVDEFGVTHIDVYKINLPCLIAC